MMFWVRQWIVALFPCMTRDVISMAIIKKGDVFGVRNSSMPGLQ